MCGRYASTRSAADLAALFEAADGTADESLAASYNVAPTDPVHIVRRGGADQAFSAERLVDVARWGLLPPWARDPREGARMINARAETVSTSRAYATPFARWRCLVPADGWYEWLAPGRDTPGGGSAWGGGSASGGAARGRVRGAQGRRGGKQPYFLTPADGGAVVFAGLWQRWRDLVTVTIITTAAEGQLRTVHDRMPLVLPPDRWEAWLDPGHRVAPEVLLAPPDQEWSAGIELRPVGQAVGDVRNNSPELIQPISHGVTGSVPFVDHAEPLDLTLF